MQWRSFLHSQVCRDGGRFFTEPGATGLRGLPGRLTVFAFLNDHGGQPPWTMNATARHDRSPPIPPRRNRSKYRVFCISKTGWVKSHSFVRDMAHFCGARAETSHRPPLRPARTARGGNWRWERKPLICIRPRRPEGRKVRRLGGGARAAAAAAWDPGV